MKNTLPINGVKNGFSVDFEDYYTGLAKPFYPSGFSYPKEVEKNTMRLLEIFSIHQTRATFFCIAMTAKQLPWLLRTILTEGHEIALHGLHHESLRLMSHTYFTASTKVAKDIIEQITGAPILGYRAPYRSLDINNIPFIDSLLNLGFIYDSSLPSSTSFFKLNNMQNIGFLYNGLIEVSVSSAVIMNILMHPIGGGYLRHLPFWWIKYCIDRIERSGTPMILYCHPYEFEPCFPILLKNKKLSLRLLIKHLRQYHNRGKKQRLKLEKILEKRLFFPLIDIVRQQDMETLPLISVTQ